MNIWIRTNSNRSSGSDKRFINSTRTSSNQTSLPVIMESNRRLEEANSQNGSAQSQDEAFEEYEYKRHDSYAIFQQRSNYHEEQSSGLKNGDNLIQFMGNRILEQGSSSEEGKKSNFLQTISQDSSFLPYKSSESQEAKRLNRKNYNFNDSISIKKKSDEEDYQSFSFKRKQQKQKILNFSSLINLKKGQKNLQINPHQSSDSSSNQLKSISSRRNMSLNQQIERITDNERLGLIPRTNRSPNHGNSLEKNYTNASRHDDDEMWTGMSVRSKRSNENKTANSIGKNTGRKQGIRQHMISIIQYCSNEVGMAIYNITNGEIHLTQIIQRLTYFRTISTIERYFPLQIIYCITFQHTPLIKKLHDKFKNTIFRSQKRLFFDQTKGYGIYNQRGNKDQYNPDNKFIAYAALNALISYLEIAYESKFTYSTLKIKWHLLEQIMVIQSQTIADLEIFLNGETKQKKNSFIQNFVCYTYGGTRMLRANMLQPSCNEKIIKQRQDLVEILLNDKLLLETLSSQIIKFKNFQIITAKFIQSPRQQNLKSLKTYLSAIYSLSHLCLLLKKFHQRIEGYLHRNFPILERLFKLLNHFKVNELRESIENNFDQQILRNYEQNKGKKQSFIFLFKLDKIEDQFAQILRITYSHTMQDIIKIFKEIKEKSREDLKLIYNQFRGYFIKTKKQINLNNLSELIEDDIIQINEKGGILTFSTSILASLNNRLKEGEKKLLLQSQSLLRKIIEQIQKSMDVLFDINYEISVVDMIISFVNFIKKYQMVGFTKPIINKNSQTLKIRGFKSVWTNQRVYKLSNQVNLEISKQKSVLICQKQSNSFLQLNMLYSFGYLIILSQIGCYVPANQFYTDLYDTLISKVNVSQNIESNLSHFQLEMHTFKNMLDNCNHAHSRCLILVDELVKGTQYEEQISLSMTVLYYLSKLKGKSVVLISDQFQLKIIERIGSSYQLMNLKQEEIEGKGMKQQKLNSGHKKRIQGYTSPFQIQKRNIQGKSLVESMRELNFNEQFLTLFEKLSIEAPRNKFV